MADLSPLFKTPARPFWNNRTTSVWTEKIDHANIFGDFGLAFKTTISNTSLQTPQFDSDNIIMEYNSMIINQGVFPKTMTRDAVMPQSGMNLSGTPIDQVSPSCGYVNELNSVDCCLKDTPSKTDYTINNLDLKMESVSGYPAHFIGSRTANRSLDINYEKDFPSLSKDHTKKKSATRKEKSNKHQRKWKHAGSDIVQFGVARRKLKHCELDSDMEAELRLFEEELLCNQGNLSQHDSNQPEIKNPSTASKEGIELPARSEHINSERRSKRKLKAKINANPRFVINDIGMKGVSGCPSSPPEDHLPQDIHFDNVIYSIDEALCLDSSLHRKGVAGGVAYRHLRNKKKWHTQKARIAIKTKNCKSFANGAHGAKLYIHHRVQKALSVSYTYPTSSISFKRIDKERGIKGKVDKSKYGKPATNAAPGVKVVPARTRHRKENHTLTAFNANDDLTPDLVNILISMQERDITPEDYELLLRLDETVAPKTVQETVLSSLKCDIVRESDIPLPYPCIICMEEYICGDSRKKLPCGHDFHDQCIETWLRNTSTKCPLDGYEIL